MKFTGRFSMSHITRLLLQVMMVITVIILATLPWVINIYLDKIRFTYSLYIKTVLLIVLYPSGICSLIIINELRKMFNSLVDNNPFIIENVKSLKYMGYSMLVILIMLIVKMITLNSIMTIVLSIASVLIIIFCFILADVFNQAVKYKIDNDLTI